MGLSDLYASLVEGGLKVLRLGTTAGGQPILAFGSGEGQRVALLIAGTPGDGALSAQALCQTLLEPVPAGWQFWGILSADPDRLEAHHDLWQKADLAEHVAERRSAWAPGEDPHTNLPVNHERFWQPDREPLDPPEGFVSCTPENIALGRAIQRLQPELLLILGECVAGGACLLSSQDLELADLQHLTAAVSETGLPPHLGAKMRVGRTQHGAPGLVILPSLAEESAKLERQDGLAPGTRFTGGVTSWQLQALHQPDSLMLGVDIPRFTHPSFADEQPTTQTRTIDVSVEERERGGKPARFQVVRLHQPGHPAHEAELRCDPLKADEQVQEGVLVDQPAVSGWLAVEAYMMRRAVLARALELLEAAVPVAETEGFQRAIPLLREAHENHDNLLKSFQQNKRYGKQASEAEAAYWTLAYPVTTAALLQEALRGLDGEPSNVEEIKSAREFLIEERDRLLADNALLAVDEEAALGALRALIGAAVACVEGNGPALVRARERVDLAARALKTARKRARDVKNMNFPRAEREQAEAAQHAATAELAAAEAHLRSLEEATTGAHVEEQAAESQESLEREEQPLSEDEPRLAEEGSASPAPAQAPAQPESEHGRDAGNERGANDTEDEPDVLADAALENTPESEPALDTANAETEATSEPDETNTAADEPEPEAEPQPEPEPEPEAEPEPTATPPADPRAPGGPEDPALDSLPPEIAQLLRRARAERMAREQTPHAASTPTPDDEPVVKPRPEMEEVPADPDDLESRLPPVIDMGSEWGRGPLDWETLLPRDTDPTLAGLTDLAKDGPPAPTVEVKRERHAELTVVEDPAENLGQVQRTPVGFRRRRLELAPRHPELIPRLAFPNPTGGRFLQRRRAVAKTG